MPGPDFPTGGIICGRQGILDGYAPAAARSPSAPAPRSTRKAVGRRSSSTKCRSADAQPPGRGDRRAGQGRTHQGHLATSRTRAAHRTGEPVRLVVYLKRDADPQLRPQPALPVLAVAEDGEHHPAGPGGRPAAVRWPQGDDGGVPAASRPGDPPAHRVPAARGQAARPRPRRPAHRHLVAGRGDPHLPRVAEPGRGQADACRTWRSAAAVLEPGAGRRAFRRLAARDRRADRATT